MKRIQISKHLRGEASVSSVPLLDVSRGTDPLRDELLEAIKGVLDSGQFIGGPQCQKFEQSFATLCETKFAIGCASGSDALLLALMALEIGPGDEVIVPSFTFFATASAVYRLGATPVFVDIEPTTFNIDPNQIAANITSSTKAIIPVHLFGQCADMDAIGTIAQEHNLHVIEDAAQAVGAKHLNQLAGSIGDIGCFSFYPTKNLGGCGDGGILTTSNSDLADRLRLLAGHGMRPRYHHSVVGINSRLDSMQAAILNVKLRHLAGWTLARRLNAATYDRLLTTVGLHEALQLPCKVAGCEHVWNQYTIRVPGGRRDAVRDWLSKANIGSEVYYPIPLHQQVCFQDGRCRAGDLPETELAAREVLSLPIFPEVTEAEQQAVVQWIGAFYNADRNVDASEMAVRRRQAS